RSCATAAAQSRLAALPETPRPDRAGAISPRLGGWHDEPTGLGCANVLCCLREPIDAGQCFARFGVEENTLGRRLQSPRTPVEQREAELLFEAGDLRTDSRLRDAQGRRGIGDRAMVDDGAERF